MKQNILINFATRGRVNRFKEALDSILDNTKQPEQMLIFVKLDSDDICLKEYEDLIEGYVQNKQNNISYTVGTSANKIDAINRDIDTVETIFDFKWAILVNWSDDMVATFMGFDNVIREVFDKRFPDGDGFPVFKDFYRKDQLCTLSIMDKKYYNRFGYVYNPEYISLYCDDEATKVSGILKRFVFIKFPIIFEHKHPNNTNTVERDERYKITESYYRQDAETFKKREARNFDLK